MANGEEIGKFGKKGDVAVKYIKDLGEKASVGDQSAISEINEIRKFVIQPRLLQEIKLLGLFGSYKPLGWNDTAYLEKITYENVKADIQAEGQDVLELCHHALVHMSIHLSFCSWTRSHVYFRQWLL